MPSGPQGRGASGSRRAPQGSPGWPRERLVNRRLEVPYLELVLKNVDFTIKNQANVLI